MKRLTLFVAATLALVCLVAGARTHYQSVLLSDVESLTFFNHRDTAARRATPIPQLKCIGALCQSKYLPSAVQCYNKGTDGVDVQWRCDAELDADVSFDAVHVSCEGFRDADDPHILEGSCGLEYRLKYTNAYHEKQQQQQRQKQQGPQVTVVERVDSNHNASFEFIFVLLLVICLASLIIFGLLFTKDSVSNSTYVYTESPTSTYFDTPPRRGSRATHIHRDASPPTYTSTSAFVDGVAFGASINQPTTTHVHTYAPYPSAPPCQNIMSASRTTSRVTITPDVSSSPSSTTTASTHTSTGFGTTSRR